jgi:hypothetical protein
LANRSWEPRYRVRDTVGPDDAIEGGKRRHDKYGALAWRRNDEDLIGGHRTMAETVAALIGRRIQSVAILRSYLLGASRLTLAIATAVARDAARADAEDRSPPPDRRKRISKACQAAPAL